MTRGTPAWLITGTLSLSGLIASLNGTIVMPLVTVLPDELGVGSDDVSWLVTITLVVGAVSIPTVSRLADMLGRRLMLMLCLVVMAVGSIVSATSSEFLGLLIGRGLAGFGVPLIPVGMSVLRDALPANRVGTSVALMSATLGIGSAIGLPLSGVLYEGWGWRSVFAITGVGAFLLAALVLVIVPKTLTEHGGRFDPLGAVLLAISTVAIVLLISKGAVWGLASPVTLGLAGAGLVSFIVWVIVELRVKHPLVDLRSSFARPILLTNVAALLVGFALLINLLLAMQQLRAPPETGYGIGLSVVEAGLLMVPGGLVMVALSPISGRLLDRTGGSVVLLLGTVIMAGGYVVRAFFSDGVVQIVIGCTIVSLGTAFAFGAMPSIIMKVVPVSMTAAANGMNALIRQIGTSSGSSAIAASLAVGAGVAVGGVVYPTAESMMLLDLLAAATCFAAAILALSIPRSGAVARDARTES